MYRTYQVRVKLLGVEVGMFDQEAPDAQWAIRCVITQLVAAADKLFLLWQVQVAGASYLGRLTTADFDYEARRVS